MFETEETQKIPAVWRVFFYGLLVVALGGWVQKGSIGVGDGTGVS